MTTTTTRVITRDDIIDAMQDAIDSKPVGYRNPGIDDGDDGGSVCRYTENDGTPSCLVGNALHNLGIELPHWSSADNTMNIGQLVRANAFREVAFTGDAHTLMVRAQFEADGGADWQTAFDNAVVYVNR